jgi:uncharacterized phage-associated protein
MTTTNDTARALNSIRFAFDERKARAAASLLLKQEGGRMPYLRLIKLLYLADREAIDRRGRPIVGGRYVSMNYGPVLSEVLDLVKRGGPDWSEVVEKVDREVRLKGEPDLGPLSEDEIGILLEAVEVYRTLDRWKLCEFTHGLPEWQDPKGGAIDITPEDILRALGKTDEAAEETRQESQERAFFDELFGR